jgi:Ca-activated chloride channel family protein
MRPTRLPIRKLGTIALAVLFLVWEAASAQRTLSVDVRLVSIFATLQDSSGNFVTNLNAEDFRVYEDGVEQKISVFEKEDAVESAIGILLDSSLSVVDILPRMREGLLQFARRFRRFEDIFVETFGTRVRLIHDQGQPVSHLEQELKVLRANGSSLLYDGLIDGMQRVRDSEHARKALIVFTDGFDNGSAAGFGAVSAEAQRSGVLLYFIPIGSRVLLDEHTLNSLAAETGGRVLYLSKTDPVAPAMEDIRQELARQYYIGYYADRRPGYHQIRIETPGKNLKVRAKKGYSGS